jgi:hypothetical protein
MGHCDILDRSLIPYFVLQKAIPLHSCFNEVRVFSFSRAKKKGEGDFSELFRYFPHKNWSFILK